jgi:hypothetical protein
VSDSVDYLGDEATVVLVALPRVRPRLSQALFDWPYLLLEEVLERVEDQPGFLVRREAHAGRDGF